MPSGRKEEAAMINTYIVTYGKRLYGLCRTLCSTAYVDGAYVAASMGRASGEKASLAGDSGRSADPIAPADFYGTVV